MREDMPLGCHHHGSPTGGSGRKRRKSHMSEAMSEAGKGNPQSTPPAESNKAEISIEEFGRLDLRTGVVTEAKAHPNADRLLVLQVDLGEGSPRQLVAGIKGSYEPSSLVGKQVAVVANMKPAKLRGVESQGMVLAATDGSTIVLLSLERPVRPGSTVK